MFAVIYVLVVAVLAVGLILSETFSIRKDKEAQQEYNALFDRYSRTKESELLAKKEAENYKKEIETLKAEITTLKAEKTCCKKENIKAVEDLPKIEKINKKSTTRKPTARKSTKKN